jgi:excisionase family DNA binding protein
VAWRHDAVRCTSQHLVYPGRMVEQKLLTVSEMAKALRMSERFVRSRIAAGGIPVLHFGRAQRIREDVILEMQKHGLTGVRHFRERPEDSER